MPIIKDVTNQGGQTLGYHVVQRVEVDPNGAHYVAAVTVGSWPNEDAYLINEGRHQSWTFYPTVPLMAVSGADFKGSVERALVEIQEVVGDNVFGGGSIAPLPSGLEAARTRQWAKVKQTRAILLSAGAMWDGSRFDTDDISRGNIMGRIMALQLAGGVGDSEWTLFDNSKRVLSFAQLCQVGQAVGAYVDGLYSTSRLLREQIYDAAKTTVAEVEAVTWPV